MGGTMATRSAWPGMNPSPAGAKCADAVATSMTASPWAALTPPMWRTAGRRVHPGAGTGGSPRRATRVSRLLREEQTVRGKARFGGLGRDAAVFDRPTGVCEVDHRDRHRFEP